MKPRTTYSDEKKKKRKRGEKKREEEERKRKRERERDGPGLTGAGFSLRAPLSTGTPHPAKLPATILTPILIYS